jgi:hypothetical protein
VGVHHWIRVMVGHHGEAPWIHVKPAAKRHGYRGG